MKKADVWVAIYTLYLKYFENIFCILKVGDVVKVVNVNAANQERIRSIINEMKDRRLRRLQMNICTLWRVYTIEKLPMRKLQMEKAVKMRRKVDLRLLKQLQVAWFKVSSGPGRYVHYVFYFSSVSFSYPLTIY